MQKLVLSMGCCLITQRGAPGNSGSDSAGGVALTKSWRTSWLGEENKGRRISVPEKEGMCAEVQSVEHQEDYQEISLVRSMEWSWSAGGIRLESKTEAIRCL